MIFNLLLSIIFAFFAGGMCYAWSYNTVPEADAKFLKAWIIYSGLSLLNFGLALWEFRK